MKKIVFLLAILGTVFIGCNPMEDIYDDIDSQPNPVVGEDIYTLTADDYAALELGFGSFDSEDQAKDLLPAFLTDKYPVWGNGSAVVVGYNLYVGSAEGVSDYTGADAYALTNEDYALTGSDAFGFYPNVNPVDEIPAVLAAQIDMPMEGQMVLARYKQYVGTPEVGLANVYEFNFDGSFDDWTVVDNLGAQGWSAEAAYAEGNGYDGGQFANEDWLVSPELDLTDESNLKFQINQAINYAGDLGLMKILVATDYSDDVATATWNEITLTNSPLGNSNDWFLSEEYDFSAYDGETINIAFKYESTDSDAGRWRIDNVAVKTLGVTGDRTSAGAYFMFTEGEWEAVEGVYFLSEADFDSMGEGFGQPGYYNNFGSSISPNDYMPQFMSVNYPYGQDEDEMIVIYDYYSSSSGAQLRGNLYTVTEGAWMGHASVVETTLQFGHDGVEWVPDNTIRYTLTSVDFDFISAALINEPGYEGPAESCGNYGNFDRRPGNANEWTDEMLVVAMDVLLNGSVAPNAEEGQKYVMTFAIYNGAAGTEDLAVIKEGASWVAQ